MLSVKNNNKLKIIFQYVYIDRKEFQNILNFFSKHDFKVYNLCSSDNNYSLLFVKKQLLGNCLIVFSDREDFSIDFYKQFILDIKNQFWYNSKLYLIGYIYNNQILLSKNRLDWFFTYYVTKKENSISRNTYNKYMSFFFIQQKYIFEILMMNKLFCESLSMNMNFTKNNIFAKNRSLFY